MQDRKKAAAEKVWDWPSFARQTFHDKALQREVLVLFLKQLDELGGLDWARDDIPFALHRLAGAAAAVGAVQLAALCEIRPPATKSEFAAASATFKRAISI